LDGDGTICGLRVKGPMTHSIHLQERYEKSAYPEVWICDDWPILKIGEDGDRVELKDASSAPLPAKAEIHSIDDPAAAVP
jgi:hypothetical protein